MEVGEDPGEALRRAVSALYAGEPAGFVARRREWVARLRSAGLREVAKEVGGLRRPSVAAAAVNAVVRADHEVVDQLEALGARMRVAQSALDAAGLTALRGERDQLLTAWVEAAREHAPEGLTAPVEAEVRDTAIAALADPAASEVVTSGSLTRALHYSGFGEVDVADAVVRTSTGVVLTRIEGGRGAQEDDGEVDETEVHGDDGEVDETEVHGEEPDVASATGAAAAADAERVAALERELDEAEKDVAAARAARKVAAADDEAAEKQVAVSTAQVEQAERLLAQARAHLDSATEARTRTVVTLSEADEELRDTRERRDAARAVLEEAEDA
ncbi:hypothetical protein [Ornithinimicrobium sp. LYQ103]|uniref:hypothetical protein n=1 Tax=Ornithinimicrobium sp. LYQ103 TaxID=3378796 RepID=UPI003852EF28